MMPIRPMIQKMKSTVQQPKYYLTKHPPREKKCLNCSTLHSGQFCPNCGQSVDKINKPFKEFLLDILDSMSAFDVRFWRSVKIMFTRPHKLTEEYLNGKRTKYMPPFKMYFFVSFLFFFVINWKADSEMQKNNSDILVDSSNAKIEMLKNSGGKKAIAETKSDPKISSLIDSISETHVIDSLLGKGNLKEKKIIKFSEKRLKKIFDEESSRR